MSSQSQVWQVMSEGYVFETDLETLKEWVTEGRVLPTDKVSKGNLSWIEAQRAPMLRPLFHPDTAVPVAAALPRMPEQPVFEQAGVGAYNPLVNEAPATADTFVTSAAPFVPASAGAVCHYHADAPPKFICRICAATFCEQCPRYVATTKIPICPLCGDLCKPFEEEVKKSFRRAERESGFGMNDFATALRYPFQNIIGVIGMSVLYGILLLAGFKGQLLAYMVLFGTITLVINNVATGRLERNFIPDFSSFSWWDDAVCPAFLGVGIWIVTLGPMIALVLAFWFGLIGGPTPAPLSLAPEQAQQEQFTEEDFDAIVKGGDPQKDEEAAKKLEQMRTAPVANIDPAYTKRQQEKETALSPVMSVLKMLNVSAWVLLVGALCVLWAIFYYPMALAVAGYTEDFKSVINPLVGLDTMRRMGTVYVKAFLMYLAVQIVGTIVSVIVGIVTAPFDMPLVGNLPAQFIDGIVAFYTNLVIACILGLALYKCADRLDIATD